MSRRLAKAKSNASRVSAASQASFRINADSKHLPTGLLSINHSRHERPA
jgi:hypothetical protein